MWGFTILAIIFIAIPISFFILSGIGMVKYSENEESKKKGMRNIIGGISAFIVAILLIFLLCKPWGFEPISPSNSDKEKCSWCGKMVDEDDMRGNFCKDCQNDAFGKDGWYN